MKLHYLFLALSACCLTISCGNSSKNQQTEVTTQQVNPLEEAFKEIKILKDSCDKSNTSVNFYREIKSKTIELAKASPKALNRSLKCCQNRMIKHKEKY